MAERGPAAPGQDEGSPVVDRRSSSPVPAESYRRLVESLQDYAIFMLDPQGHVTTWNAGARAIKGYASEEIVGKHFSVFFPEEDAEAERPRQALATAAAEGRWAGEGWRKRKDGSRFWASVVLTALRDDDAQLVAFAKVTRDLTAAREAEETARALIREQAARATAEEAEVTLREERERYKALSRRLEVILEGVADGITVQDRSGRLTFANTAAARLCGFASAEEMLRAKPADIVGRFEMLDEDGKPFLPERLPGRRVLAGAASATAVLGVRALRTGEQWWSMVRATGVVDEQGHTELAVNILHDISADRRREEQERYLGRATAALSSSLDYQTTLSVLAQALVPGFADWCVIHLLEHGQLHSVAVVHVDPAKVAMARAHQERHPPDPQRASGVWQVLRSGRSELYADIPEEMLVRSARDAEHLEMLRAVGIKSVMLVPIRMRDGVSGTISLVSAESGRRYHEADVALAEELGRRAGASIENARLYAAERKARSQLELLARAGEAFSATVDYEDTLREVVHIALPVLGDFAFFDVVEGAEVRRLSAAHQDPEVALLLARTRWVRSERVDKNLCALSSGQMGLHPHIDDAWMQDVASGPDHLMLLRRLQLGSMVTVPLRGRGEVLGSLTLCFGKSGRHHTDDDARLATELARRAALALVQVQLYRQAQAAAARAEEAALRAEEASRIKDEFLATVSHELRTPLNAMLGWSALLRGRSDDTSLDKGIDAIHRNAQAQAKIIEDILDVSRIVTGQLRLDLATTDLLLIVHEAIEVTQPSADAKSISITFAPALDAAPIVVDHPRVRQVLWNLLSNAVKFTDRDGTIVVSVRREPSSLVISVRDTGRGIDPAFLPHVFERFRQGDGSSTRRFGGLGLGLSIVRHIVELHGGQVHAASDGPGTGATFEVTFPVRAVAPQALPAGLSRPSADRGGTTRAGMALQGVRLLVVDDDPDARELLRMVLENAGAVVETVASAAAGAEAMPRFRPDVLMSDIGMPGEDGHAFLRRVRAGGGAAASVPAIALTAYARDEDRRKSSAAGFEAHIAKPIDPNELLGIIAELVARKGRVGAG